MKTRSVALIMLVACLPLAACGKKTPSGQVAATVNGKEVTVQEVQAELNGYAAPDAKTRKLAEQQALQNIVARKILVAAAEKAGVAKSPEFAIQKQRMEDGLLVQAWQNSLVNAVPQPAPEEVQQFIAQHPDYYSAHKVFVLDQLRIPRLNDNRILDELKPLNTLEDIDQALQRHGIHASSARQTVDALSFPPQILDQVLKQPPNNVFVLPANGILVANKIVETKIIPLPDDTARRHATQYIRTQHAQEALRRQFGAVLQQGQAKVQYNPVYAPPAPPKKTAPAPAAPATAGKPR